MTAPFSTRISATVNHGSAVQLCIVALLIASAWLAYRPGLDGPFLFDDFSNITGNRLIAIERLSLHELAVAALSNKGSFLDRPLPRITFALNYFFSGKTFDPFVFKITNLVVHAANVVIVYFLLRVLFSVLLTADRPENRAKAEGRAVTIAALAAALWGLHPLNLSSVLYVVQRMNSMSAFFVLAGILGFAFGRRLFPDNPARGISLMAGAVIGGVSLGFLCKENAVLLPLLMVVVELAFFSRGNLAAGAKRYLAVFYGVLLGLPVTAGVVFLLFNPDFVLGSYVSREFSLAERLLTEPRVLFFYLSLIFVPSISRLGLYHDDFQLSTGLLAPPSTLLAILAWSLIVIFLVAGLRRRAVWAFGLAWFLAGHALESTLIGLELAHEHRNYVPAIGICAMIVYYLAALFEKLRSGVRLLVVSGLCVVLAFGFVTYARAEIWSTRISLYESLARYHPASYRSLAGLALTMIDTKRDVREVYQTYAMAARANAHAVYPLVWMARILQGLRASNLPRRGGAGAAPEDSPEMIEWDAEMVLERNRVDMLARAVSMEIRNRLSAGKTHIETIEVLTTTQQCLLNGRDDCVGLRDQLMEWHLIALDRLPSWRRERAALELSIARLYFERGDREAARQYVDRAVASSGHDSGYRLEKALFHVRLGNIVAAEDIIDDIERRMGWRRAHADDIVFLREEIKNALANRGAAVTSAD